MTSFLYRNKRPAKDLLLICSCTWEEWGQNLLKFIYSFSNCRSSARILLLTYDLFNLFHLVKQWNEEMKLHFFLSFNLVESSIETKRLTRKKLYFSSLDPEQKDCLIEVIEKLLKDKTTVRIEQSPRVIIAMFSFPAGLVSYICSYMTGCISILVIIMLSHCL